MLPERFDATYVGEDGARHRPVMLHRAVFGTFERFIGLLIEHYAGRFPLWLAPRQVVVAPIVSDANGYAGEVVAALKAAGVRAEADLRNEKINYKVREHSLAKVPVILAVGNREVDDRTRLGAPPRREGQPRRRPRRHRRRARRRGGRRPTSGHDDPPPTLPAGKRRSSSWTRSRPRRSVLIFAGTRAAISGLEAAMFPTPPAPDLTRAAMPSEVVRHGLIASGAPVDLVAPLGAWFGCRAPSEARDLLPEG